MSETRYPCFVEDWTVYVAADVGRVEVGPLADVLDHFGAEYEIEYEDWEKDRYDAAFADEGMVLDVRETLEEMTLNEEMVNFLKDKPLEPTSEDSYFRSGRMALFCGFLNYDLDHGPA